MNMKRMELERYYHSALFLDMLVHWRAEAILLKGIPGFMLFSSFEFLFPWE